MSDPTDEHLSQANLGQKKLETWAANRIKSWEKLNPDDYDFQSWANEAKKNCLSAGAVYEYARESRKLRCLLTLMNPKRPREDWEMVRPAIVDGKQPDPSDPLAQPRPFPCSFEDLDEHEAERALDGYLYCLRDLADYLADNISFTELFRAKREELEKAFGGLDELARVQREFRYFLPVDDAVEMAPRSKAEWATVLESFSADEKRIIFGEACSEVIAVQIHWRFTNSEIFATMKKLLRALRDRNEKYKPRQPKKGSRRDSIQSALDCLSAMRLASYFPKTSPPPTPGALSAWLSGASPELKKSAVELFNVIRLGGKKDIAESNFDALIIEARKLFLKTLPFGESAENAPTLAERIMMKSKRISS